MEDILKQLVSYATVANNPDAQHQAVEYVAAFLSDRGMHVDRYSFGGNETLVATTKAHSKTLRVMLAAHIDVVPAAPALFTITVEDDKLRGRGVWDMKFAIACYLQLVDDLKEKLTEYDFGIMITSDEELGRDQDNGTKMLLEQGYRPEVAILPDGGYDWHLERAAKGAWHFDITARGKTAHGSRPWEGDSAADRLLDTLAKIRQLFVNYQKPDTPTLTIGTIHGGAARNQIPDIMTAGIDIRVTTLDELNALKSAVRKICDDHKAALEEVVTVEPTATDLNDPYVKQFMSSVEAVRGVPCETSVSFGQTDGAYFCERKIPCIICQPTGGGHHSDDEWLDRKAFADYKKVLTDFLESTGKMLV